MLSQARSILGGKADKRAVCRTLPSARPIGPLAHVGTQPDADQPCCSYTVDTSRRSLLLGFSVASSFGAALLAVPAAQAKTPAIVNILKGKAGERDVVTTSTGVKYAVDAEGQGPNAAK